MGFKRTVVLIVSHNNMWLEQMQDMLGAIGCISVLLTGGQSVLEAAKALTPDIVLLDLGRKGGTALNAARNLKKDILTKDIPLLLASSYLEANDRGKTSFEHIDFWLQKPFTQRDIIKAIKEVLNKRTDGDSLQQSFSSRAYVY